MGDVRSVIFLAPLAPASGGNGLAMRAGMLLEALAERVPVELVVVPLSGAADDLEWAKARARTVHVVEPVADRAARPYVTAQLADPRLRTLLERTAPLPTRAMAAPPTLATDVVRALGRTLARPVAVLALRAYLAPLATEVGARVGAARLVVDLDDDDEGLLRALGECAEAEAFHRLAEAWLPGADAVLAASPIEAAVLGQRYRLGDVLVVPNAVRPPAGRAPLPGGARLLFVGNLTYTPNLEAAALLVDEVLPAVRRRRPDATVDVVGPFAPGTFDHFGAVPGVEIGGLVRDLAPWYARAAAVVVPLRHGAGTRIKVLEAFAHGRPVVATPAAVAGLDVRDGEEVLVADSPGALAEAVVALLDDPELAAAVADRAARTLAARYAPSVVGSQVQRAVLGSGRCENRSDQSMGGTSTR